MWPFGFSGLAPRDARRVPKLRYARLNQSTGNLGRRTLQVCNKAMNAAKSGSRSNGDTEVKARSFPDSALNPEASTVSLHDVPRDRKAQAGATSFTGTRGVYPVEALKNSLLLCLGDSNTRVGDGDHDVAIRAGRRDVDFSAGGRILQGVVEKIL